MITTETMRIHCDGLADNGAFPLKYTGRGLDASPAFRIFDFPSNTQTFAITLEDRNHPIFKDFTHWLIWNIPAGDSIPGAIPPGKRVKTLNHTVQGLAYGIHKYAGPKPPKGARHQYRFTVYALDCELSLTPCATKRIFLRKAKPHILQKAALSGTFE